MTLRLLLTGVLIAVLVCGCGGGTDGESYWLTPDRVSLSPGQSQEFTLHGSSLREIVPLHLVWTVEGGSYTQSGISMTFTAGYTPGSYTITVTDDSGSTPMVYAYVTVR